ncbi:MAG: MT-A70 family methyltransferase, partial [Planctomycetota bacterium]|nr:MT-A70 family methyltransferase [Planctomycetota bacterium]
AEIQSEPVRELAADRAHLHLWTTNGFLGEALELLEIWGFEYKSCFVWVKPQLGCGNYWRVSHEFLLLGVRGGLPFQDHSQMSWMSASRMEHSRKPGRVRMLIEQVSPGPYLEMYGRSEIPDSDWTVYGNRVEHRLF